MFRIVAFITFYLLVNACVSTGPVVSQDQVSMDCQTLEHASFQGFFAVECRLSNHADSEQIAQISYVRFPNFNEDMVMFVPNYSYQQTLSYQNNFRPGSSLSFEPLASALAGKSSAKALSALITHVVKQGKGAGYQSQMGYEKNFLLRNELRLKPHQTIKALVLLQKKQHIDRLPPDIEISVSRPSESILTRSL